MSSYSQLPSAWCFETGVQCCDGQVGAIGSAALPSQFFDAFQPSGDLSLTTDGTDIFSDSTSTPPDQFNLLGTSDSFLATDPFALDSGVSNIDVQNDLLAANGDASWFLG